MDFCINLTQFYINFSRQKHQLHQLYVLYVTLTPEILRPFILHPFYFSFTVPLKMKLHISYTIPLKLILFPGYALPWCSTHSESHNSHVMKDEHSPGRFEYNYLPFLAFSNIFILAQ